MYADDHGSITLPLLLLKTIIVSELYDAQVNA